MRGRTLCLAVTGILLIACQPKGEPEPDPVAPGEQAAAVAARAEADPAPPVPAVQQRNSAVVDTRIVEVTLSDRGDPETGVIGPAVPVFQPADTVYVSVEMDGTAREYMLYAKWLDEQGGVLSEYGLGIDQPGQQRRVLSLSKPDGWQPGRHGVELVINDGNRRTVPFQVASP